MIAEAIDTAVTLGWAFAAWLAVFAVVGTIVIFAAAATGAWAVRALWRAPGGPSWARGAVRARIHARIRARRPSGRTADTDYEEAA